MRFFGRHGVILRLGFLFAALLCGSRTEAGEESREFAGRFYRALNRWGFRGVPLSHNTPRMEPWLGMEAIRVFRRVNEQREQYCRAYPIKPDEPRVKPPWCLEGDVFCDSWEGFTYFSVGRVHRRGGRLMVNMHLEYIELGKSYPWTDIVVLDRAGDRWVVADIEFADGGSLLEGIRAKLARVERQIAEGRTADGREAKE